MASEGGLRKHVKHRTIFWQEWLSNKYEPLPWRKELVAIIYSSFRNFRSIAKVVYSNDKKLREQRKKADVSSIIWFILHFR